MHVTVRLLVNRNRLLERERERMKRRERRKKKETTARERSEEHGSIWKKEQ